MEEPTSSGRDRLAKVQRDVDARQEQERLAASNAELQRRKELYEAASGSFRTISHALLDAVRKDAPGAEIRVDLPPDAAAGAWSAYFLNAAMMFEGPHFLPVAPRGLAQPLPFEVIATGSVRALRPPAGVIGHHVGYAGRGHSLYYCDAQTAGTYAWFETAFAPRALPAQESWTEPCALGLGDRVARALSAATADYRVAWPFTHLPEELGDFVDRWAGWFADAIGRRLAPPSQIPERPVDGTWRRR